MVFLTNYNQPQRHRDTKKKTLGDLVVFLTNRHTRHQEENFSGLAGVGVNKHCLRGIPQRRSTGFLMSSQSFPKLFQRVKPLFRQAFGRFNKKILIRVLTKG
ncbi:hypothetical protein WN50_09560 [Limnoraphis robusta CS-951]|uniref:Uncharacterized protein n=1 Tax=Limnoraphis robusta CS-951 TaxID=1637645 RepID=A0A0F5YJE6_9CYAN|nr:hypothetical protein WN50_09560 [Limnoraphis robusta CS-951]